MQKFKPILLIFLFISPTVMLSSSHQHTSRFNNSISALGSENSPIDFFYINLTRREAIARFIRAFQVEGGLFVDSLIADAPGYLETYEAVYALYKIGMLDYVDTDAIVNYILSKYLDGAIFSPSPPGGYMSEVADAILTLKLLGKLDLIDREEVINFVLSGQTENGLFASFFDANKRFDKLSITMVANWGAIAILDALNALDRIDKEKFVKSFFEYYYDPETGAFYEFFLDVSGNLIALETLLMLDALNDSIMEKNFEWVYKNWDSRKSFDKEDNIGGTYCEIASFRILGHFDVVDVNKTVELVLSMQSHRNGGFYSILYLPEDRQLEMIQPTIIAVKLLELLDALDRLDEPFYILREPQYQGDWPNVSEEEDLPENPFENLYQSPELNNSSPLMIALTLVAIFGIVTLVVLPVFLLVSRKLDKRGSRSGKRRRKRRNRYR